MKSKGGHFSSGLISPSDVGQSYVRLGIVLAIALWTFSNERPGSLSEVLADPILISMPIYFGYCVFLLFWSYSLAKISDPRNFQIRLKRTFGLFSDLISCAAYIFLAGDYGIAIYPIYVTIIVGYGLRFGLGYLVMSIAVALTTFSVAAIYSPLFEKYENLMLGFYLGLLLIPGYAAILLKKYQDLLIKLSEVNAARARFIANMSHEVRTPLHAIVGNAEVIDTKLSELHGSGTNTEQIATSVRMLSEASEHLRVLVDGILDIASNDAGIFVLGERSPVNIYALTRSVVEIVTPSVRDRETVIYWHIDPSVPSTIETWVPQLKAILINTLGNAAKYTERGEVNLKLLAERDTDPSQYELRISIKDTGVGISETQLSTIFEPFAIGDDSRSRKFEGTGLGLTITKQYVDEMKGAISINSEVGLGTELTIKIPVRANSNPSVTNNNLLRKPNALLVTSNVEDRERDAWLATMLNVTVLRETEISEYTKFQTKQPNIDLVIIDGTVNEELKSLARYLNESFENAPLVILDPVVAFQNELPSEVVTTIQSKCIEHLNNICSIVPNNNHEIGRRVASRRRILVIDDNETNLQSAKIALETIGHTVHILNDGINALTKMEGEEYDLVFMDMHMPGLSGIEISKMYALTSQAPVPIVILTADATSTANYDSDIPEVVGFLTKPIKPSELQRAVEKFARTKEQRESDRRDLEDHPIMKAVRKSAFSKENYTELIASGATEEQILDLVSRFISDSGQVIDEAVSEAKADDAIELRRTLHKLKGSAGAMYSIGLVNAIDHVANRADPVVCKELLQDAIVLKRGIAVVGEEIRQFVKGFNIEG